MRHPASLDVSVIVRTRVGGDALARALKSVRAQSYGNYEFIVVDAQGSDDASAWLEYEILKDFPFDEYTFVALTIEGASCDRLLAENGYCRVVSPWCEVAWEHFFVHPGTAEGAAVVAAAASGPG